MNFSIQKSETTKSGMIMGFFSTLIACIVAVFFTFKLGLSSENGIFPLIISILAFITNILYIIQYIGFIKLPNELGFITDEGIIINKKNITISYNAITKVKFKQMRTRYKIYSCGTITIKTKNKTYKMKYAENCKNVSQFIIEIINKLLVNTAD